MKQSRRCRPMLETNCSSAPESSLSPSSLEWPNGCGICGFALPAPSPGWRDHLPPYSFDLHWQGRCLGNWTRVLERTESTPYRIVSKDDVQITGRRRSRIWNRAEELHARIAERSAELVRSFLLGVWRLSLLWCVRCENRILWSFWMERHLQLFLHLPRHPRATTLAWRLPPSLVWMPILCCRWGSPYCLVGRESPIETLFHRGQSSPSE